MADRLTAFLDWYAESGRSAAQLPDVRWVAAKLLERSRGGRVIESHILQVLDEMENKGTAGITGDLVQSVGDAFLRFEKEIRESGKQLPTAPGSAGAYAPRRKTPAPRPPRISSARQAAALQFRCAQCAMVVTPTADGHCPRCGLAPPQRVQAGASGEWEHRERTRRRIQIRRPGLLAAAVVGGLVTLAGVTHFGSLACDRMDHPSQAVSGEVQSEHLGISLVFPRGWRWLEREDIRRSQTVGRGSISLAASRYFKGSRAGDPDVLLWIATVAGAGQGVITESQFEAVVERVREPVAGIAHRTRAKLDGCELTELGMRRAAGRCTGTLAVDGRTMSLLAYLWLLDDRLVALMLAADSIDEDVVDEAEALVLAADLLH